MKRLLITTDDFGMCHSINRGIVLAMTKGLARSSNIMAPAAWAFEATQLAKREGLPVGVHLTATSEWTTYRYRPLTEGRSLRRADGSFPGSHEELAAQVVYEELECEYRAQIDWVEKQGIAPTHLDTHMLGAYDGSPHGLGIQEIVARLARERALPYTYERRTPSSEKTLHFAEELVISPLPTSAIWEALERWSTPGTYHLITHAAVTSEELFALADSETAMDWAVRYRERDLALLLDEKTRERLSTLAFELISVSDLVAPQL